jgi:hypothetical protein
LVIYQRADKQEPVILTLTLSDAKGKGKDVRLLFNDVGNEFSATGHLTRNSQPLARSFVDAQKCGCVCILFSLVLP